MTEKRLAALFMAFILLFSVVLGRCYLTACNARYARAAKEQTSTLLNVHKGRGNFYDRLNRPLTGYGYRYQALCVPGEGIYSQLYDLVSENGQNILYQRRNSTEPFLLSVPEDLTEEGIFTVASQGRYWPCPVACHLLGYVNGEGEGVSGLELACNELLDASGDTSLLQCATTANGHLVEGQKPLLSCHEGTHLGLKLTLDEPLQRACEAISAQTMESGAIVVLESRTGKVWASVSCPGFDPAQPEKSFWGDDGALVDRVFAQYNVGSVFKPVLAACALEKSKWKAYELYTCKGYEKVDGQIYHCAGGVPHGEIDMTAALAQSCNCYFIRLGAELGGGEILEFCRQMGLGEAAAAIQGLKESAGHLPEEETLKNTGQLANFSFGQGELTATPIQVAALMNVFANKGEYIAPAFLEAVIDQDTLEQKEKLYEKTSRRVLSGETVGAVKEMLVGVVEEGTGREARPPEETAGGKTGTAQTGSFTPEREERMNFWFAGFYPALKPEFTIVVLQDNQTEPKISSAAVFSKVCNALKDLQIC